MLSFLGGGAVPLVLLGGAVPLVLLGAAVVFLFLFLLLKRKSKNRTLLPGSVSLAGGCGWLLSPGTKESFLGCFSSGGSEGVVPFLLGGGGAPLPP